IVFRLILAEGLVELNNYTWNIKCADINNRRSQMSFLWCRAGTAAKCASVTCMIQEVRVEDHGTVATRRRQVRLTGSKSTSQCATRDIPLPNRTIAGLTTTIYGSDCPIIEASIEVAFAGVCTPEDIFRISF